MSAPGTAPRHPAVRRWAGAGLATVLVAVALAPVSSQSGGGSADPFAMFAPLVTLSADERARLAGREVVTRTLPGRAGQLGIFVATRVDAPAEALAEWTRAIAAFKRSRFVLGIGRFSDPPALADLDDLRLDDRDVDDVRQCRPGDCALKLAAHEIAALVDAGRGGDREAVQTAFRRVVLARLEVYRRGGLGALPPLVDHDPPQRLDAGLDAIVEQSPYLTHLPALRAWLQPASPNDAAVESFFYWSKEHYGSGKPVVSVTHVGIIRPEPAPGRPSIVVAGKQLLATHYGRASLGLTMILPGSGGAPAHFVYLNRSTLDVLGGVRGALARGTMERRMSRQVPLVVLGLRDRLESGPPPQ